VRDEDAAGADVDEGGVPAEGLDIRPRADEVFTKGRVIRAVGIVVPVDEIGGAVGALGVGVDGVAHLGVKAGGEVMMRRVEVHLGRAVHDVPGVDECGSPPIVGVAVEIAQVRQLLLHRT